MMHTANLIGMTRAERMEVDDFIRVIGFVDDNDKLVANPADVGDRFQTRYAYIHGPTGTIHISEAGIALSGITNFSMRDAVNFGFSTCEYLDLREWERQSSHFIQTEQEMTALYDSAIRNDLPYP